MMNVLINGYLGKMGQAVVKAINDSDKFSLVCCVDINSEASDSNFSKLSEVREEVIRDTHCVIDFSNASGFMESAKFSLSNSIPFVSGSTGYSQANLDDIKHLADEKKVGVALCSNFSTGAILMSHIGSIAAKFYEYAELIESHHENKVDAPSGTSISIADAVSEGNPNRFKKVDSEVNKISNTRGGDGAGVNIHSLRLPGIIARHELIFGAKGENLTIIHNSSDRESFMPGVLLAAEHVVKNNEFIVGLENILGL